MEVAVTGSSPAVLAPPTDEAPPDASRVFRVVQSDRTTWVLVGRGRNAVNELEELARAFVGSSFARVEVLPADRLRDDFPFASEADQLVVVHPVAQHATVVEARLLKLSMLLAARPTRTATVARSLQQVLADLRVAMAARDRDGAEDLLSELKARNDITRSNLAFLRIQVLARAGEFDEVLAHPDLQRIVGSRRPRDVTQALLEAADAAHLSALDYTNVEDWAIAGTHIRRLLGPVAETVIPARSIPEARVFLATELANTPPQLDRISDVLDYLEEQGVALGDLLPAEQPRVAEPPEGTQAADVLPAVLRCLNRRQFGEALRLLDSADPTIDLAWAAFNVHSEIGSDASQRMFQRLAGPLREDLDGVEHARLLRALDQIATGGSLVADPASWEEWLERARAGIAEHELVALADRGGGGWEATLDTAAAVAEFVAADHELVLRPAYGVVLEHHEPVLDTPAGVNLLLEIIELVATVGPTTEELAVLPGWFESIVMVRNDPATLDRLTDVVEILIDERPSPVGLASVVDLVGVLTHHPTERGAVLDLAEKVAGWIRKFGDIADESVRLAHAETLRDLGAPRDENDPFWQPAVTSVLARLRGKRIGIYTLMTSVGSRIKRALEEWIGDGEIEVNGDAVSTDRLTSLALNADVMFVVTGAAKHAATNAIKAVRGQRPMVQIDRKGFTALFQEIKAWAAGLPESK